MTPLLLLAEKVEGLSGLDREVDGDIWWATRSKSDIDYLDPSGFVRRCIEKDGSAGVALHQFFDSSNPSCLAKIAFQSRYTASLDAALSLVPEGIRWRLGHDEDVAGVFMAQCTYSSAPTRSGFVVAYSRSAACAIVAASLRVRAAMEAGE